MYSKRLRPYIIEFLTFLFIFSFVIVYFTVTQNIVIEWGVLPVALTVLVAIWLISYMFSFVPFAILVITDLMFKDYETVTAKFVEQHIFKSSSFLDGRFYNKKTKEIKHTEILYYKVIVKSKGNNHIFTSSEHFELIPNEKYNFVIGRKSKALVDVCITEN